MDNLLRLLLRLLIVPLGAVAGMIAALAIILVGYWQLGDLISGVTDIEAVALADALMTTAFALIAIVVLMGGLALIGVLFSEAFAVRSWVFHVANGAISALIAAQIFPPYPDAPVPFNGMLYILGAGLAGGLVYWAVAGWSAGFWKPLGPAQAAAPLPPAQPVPPAAVPPAN
ncbi:hypothetical protein [Ancylobacter sp.]|uniref:hypothetical protein n=1 Tax=Ancylobacter sp. TaxID=1872567 RepID=UPI003BA95C8C